MPYKRQTRKKNKLIKKQDKYNQFLIARLTEIDLRVGDHVYEDVLISSDEAQKYLDEISSFDLNKCKDKRILQVSEKLLRCMKRVIIENSETNNVLNQNEETEIAFEDEKIDYIHPVSPTFSIENETSTTVSNQVINADITLDVNNLDFQKNEVHIKDNEFDPNTLDEYVDLHRALSNLSITEIEKINAEVCSQSILSDLDTAKVAADDFSQNILMDFDTKISEPYVGRDKRSDSIQAMYTNNNNSQFFKKPKEIVSKKVSFNLNNPVSKTKNVKTLRTQKDNKTANFIEMPKSKTKRKLNKTENKQTAIINKKPRKKRNVNKIKLETNKPSLTQTHKEIDSYTNITIECTKPMNKTIVNYLSWVEDLKYVRVVSKDEIDAEIKILDDNFWNNLDLPPNWDNTDFEL